MKKPMSFLLMFLGSASLSQALETVITGARMELKEKGDIVIFSGGVQLDRGPDVLRALRMETNQTRDKVKAEGAVEFERKMSSTETIVGYGDRGFYDTQKGEGYLTGKGKQSRLIYTQVVSSTITKKVDIVADRFDFGKASSTVVGKGAVYGKTRDPETNNFYEFWSDEAEYNGFEKGVVLTGKNQPLAKQQNGPNVKTIKGNTLTYIIGAEEFQAQGNAQAVFIEEKK